MKMENVFLFNKDPLSRFPQGGKAGLFLPLWGKVRKGVYTYKIN
jgi:hypothetical protein